MHELRPATVADLARAASWVRNAEDAVLWAGPRVSFPVDFQSLDRDLQFYSADSWSLDRDETLIAFGQIVPKPNDRRHLARLIVEPENRGAGLGRVLAERLVARALEVSPRRISLNADPGNDRALTLYESLGFREVSRPPDETVSSSLYLELAA